MSLNLTREFLNFALATGSQWVMYLLLFCSIISFAVIIDRLIFFQKSKGHFGEFIEGLTDRLNSNESIESTKAWCSAQKTLEASVAAVGLEKARQSPQAAEESMNAVMISARTKLERGIIILGTLGNNTPFIGLFGTIIGIMKAFHALAQTENAGPELVMSSIAESLSATAMGIFVAVPAVIAYNFFNRAVKKKLANSNATASIILTHIGSKNG